VVSVEVRLFRSKPSFLAQFASDFQPIQWNYVKKPDFFLAPRFSVELPGLGLSRVMLYFFQSWNFIRYSAKNQAFLIKNQARGKHGKTTARTGVK
jgi:hypothetical protein